MDKRGISGLVAVVLLISISIVAVILFASILKPMLEEKSGEIQTNFNDLVNKMFSSEELETEGIETSEDELSSGVEGGLCDENSIEISSCEPLNQEGKTYCLTKDLTTSSTCFTIESNNIILNFNGYSITGDAGEEDFGVYIKGYNGTTIKNGIIYDFGDGLDFQGGGKGAGIYLGNNKNNNIKDMIINRLNGFTFTGIYLESSSNNFITNNILNGNGGNRMYGIYLTSNSDYNTLTHNDVSQHQDGIYINSSSNNKLIENYVNWNYGGAGIYIKSGSNNNLTNNNLDSNGNYGIYLDSSSDNILDNNYAMANGDTPGFDVGIYLDSSFNNLIQNNIACSNGDKDLYCVSSTGNHGTGNSFTTTTQCDEGWPTNLDYGGCSGLAEANQKNNIKYLNQEIFMISDEDWRDFFHFFPVVVWQENNKIQEYPFLHYNLNYNYATFVDQTNPVIHRDNIVWQDDADVDYDIYFYDLSSKQQDFVAIDVEDQINPSISGNNIVWQDDRNGNYDIYLYDLLTKTETQITDNEYNQINPAISGNTVVWQDDRNGSYNIYSYDLSTKTEIQITSDLADQINPTLYGNNLVWQDNRNGNYDIYLYSFFSQKETQITNNEYNQINPISNINLIFWQDNRNGNYDIYSYDIITQKETQITSDLADQINPTLYGNNLIWQDNRNGNYDIYLYDLSTKTEIQITSDEFDQINPAISYNNLVWQDNRNGNYDIYLYDLSTLNNVDNNWCEGADITKDGIVDGADLSLLSSRWLRDDCSGSTETSSDCTNISGKYFIVSESVPISENSWCNGADVNRDGSVDPGDSDDLMFWRTFEGNPCSLSNSLCNNNVDINKDGLVDDIDDELMMAEFGRDDCSETVISATETSTPDISSTTSSSSSLDTSSSSSLTETELASNEIIEVESQEELDGFVKNAIEKIMGEEIEGDLKSKSVVLLTVLVLVAIGIIIFFSVSFLRKPKR